MSMEKVQKFLIFFQMQLKILKSQNIWKETPLLIISLIQYSRQFWNSEIVQSLQPLKFD